MKIRIFLVALILTAQIAGIFCASRAREREWQNNPTFRLKCISYDPRDLLRGHYLPLRFEIENAGVPFSKFDTIAQKQLREALADDIDELFKSESKERYVSLLHHQELWAILAPNGNTGIWEIENVVTQDPGIDFNTNPQGRKIALKARFGYGFRLKKTGQNPEDFFTAGSPVEIKPQLEFNFPNRRFYLSEEKAKRFDREFGNDMNRVSVELFFRDDGTLIPKRILVDGKEY